MDPVNLIGRLVAEIGPLNDYTAVIGYEAEELWRVAVDEDVVVDIELDGEAGCAVLSTFPGMPAPDPAGLHRLMLAYNAQWRSTGGLHLALDGDGSALLMARVPLQGLDRSRLSTVIDNLASATKGWRAIVARPDGASAKTFADEGLAFGGFIRG